MNRSILDFRPVNEEVVATAGAEPSLRELVYRYYEQHIDDLTKAMELACDYCEQIARYESAGAKRER